MVKKPPASEGDIRAGFQFLGRKNSLEEVIATHSGILAWRIPWANGAWHSTAHGVVKSWTRLKRLDMHACKSK